MIAFHEMDRVGVGRDREVSQALELCRSGQWERGLPLLGRLAENGNRLSGIAYSYLGYGVAMSERRVAEGVKLCRHAVRMEFYQPEAWLNLARTETLAGHRREAVAALQRGLALDKDHPELIELRKTMGLRRPPVLSFLSRGNLLNRILGRVRHAVRGN